LASGNESRSGSNEHELGLRRLTAAAYGFSSWDEFKAWRRRNPTEYRRRSRELLADEPTPSPDDSDALVVDLLARTDTGKTRRTEPDPQ
jgi:hypothetical protein